MSDRLWKPLLPLGFLLTLGCAEKAGAQEWRSLTSSRKAAGEDALRVEVAYGAGSLKLQPGTPGLLYRSNLRYDAGSTQPVTEYRNGRLRVGLEGLRSARGHSFKEARLDLALSREVPVDLQLEFGAVEAEIELGGLRLRSAQIATGASETTIRFSEPNRELCEFVRVSVGAAEFQLLGLGNSNAARLDLEGGVGDILVDFSGEWQRDMEAEIDMGLGALKIRLPRGLGVRINRESLLSSFDGQELVQRGKSYYSQNWSSADRRLTIDLGTAFGSVEVQWVDVVTLAR